MITRVFSQHRTYNEQKLFVLTSFFNDKDHVHLHTRMLRAGNAKQSSKAGAGVLGKSGGASNCFENQQF
jgi:hypothetical protein